MDKIWDRKSFEVGGHWPLWRGWKTRMTTQNRQMSNAKKVQVIVYLCCWTSSRLPLFISSAFILFSGYLLDPHTAVAKHVAERFQQDRPMIIVSTAHPGKFADDILEKLGQKWADGLTPTEMLRTLANIAPLPDIHKSLHETLKRSESQERHLCDNNYGSIVDRVGKLAYTLK